MCDKETHQRIKYFPSMTEAGIFLNQKHARSHISHVCCKKAPSAYGYFWEYAEDKGE